MVSGVRSVAVQHGLINKTFTVFSEQTLTKEEQELICRQQGYHPLGYGSPANITTKEEIVDGETLQKTTWTIGSHCD